jgi:hypothetical protein
MSVRYLVSDLPVITIDLAYERSFGYALIKIHIKSELITFNMNFVPASFGEVGHENIIKPSHIAVS